MPVPCREKNACPLQCTFQCQLGCLLKVPVPWVSSPLGVQSPNRPRFCPWARPLHRRRVPNLPSAGGRRRGSWSRSDCGGVKCQEGTGNLLKPRTRTGNGADYESVGLFDAFDFKHGLPTTSFTCQPQCSMHLIKCSRRIVRPVSERLNLQIRDACDAGQPIVIGNKKLAAFRHRTGQLDGIGRT